MADTPEMKDRVGDMPRQEEGPADLPSGRAAELDEELSTIYGEPEETREEMTRLDRARGLTAKKVLVGLIVFFGALAAIAWAGFFFFSPTGDKFTGERVALSIEGPGEIKSGELVEYVVKYDNDEGVALGTASLELRMPKDFVPVETRPAAENFSWKIGSVAPEKGGEIRVSGIFLSALKKEMDLQAILTYRPADFNSEFQRVATRTLLVGSSVIELELEGPNKVLPGDATTLTIRYRNTSENSFEKVAVRAHYPEGFIPETSLPQASDDAHESWLIPSMGPGAEGEIVITGSFASAVEGELTISAEAGFLKDDETFQTQAEAEFSTDVLLGELVTTLILNGKTGDQAVRFGDTLRYAVTYRNTGSASLGNVELSVLITTEPASEIILWNDLKDESEGVRDGGRITWTAKQVKSLERIGEGEEGVIEFQLPIAGSAPAAAQGLRVESLVEATIESIDGDVVERRSKSQPIAARLLSDTTLSTGARYFSGDGIPVGTGPLPPKVGEATTYRVTWHIANTLHELTDLRLSAKLPENVSFTGNSNVDAGDLRFDAAQEKMVWTLNWMPVTVESLDIVFDVAITPTEDQRGKIPTLVDATILEANDNTAESSVILSNTPLTTALEDDPDASGKGRVE